MQFKTMQFREQLELIKRLDALIKRKGTGSASELAVRLNISRATVYRYLNELKHFGAEIEFCRHRNSFIYQNDFKLRL